MLLRMGLIASWCWPWPRRSPGSPAAPGRRHGPTATWCWSSTAPTAWVTPAPGPTAARGRQGMGHRRCQRPVGRRQRGDPPGQAAGRARAAGAEPRPGAGSRRSSATAGAGRRLRLARGAARRPTRSCNRKASGRSATSSSSATASARAGPTTIRLLALGIAAPTSSAPRAPSITAAHLGGQPATRTGPPMPPNWSLAPLQRQPRRRLGQAADHLQDRPGAARPEGVPAALPPPPGGRRSSRPTRSQAAHLGHRWRRGRCRCPSRHRFDTRPARTWCR